MDSACIGNPGSSCLLRRAQYADEVRFWCKKLDNFALKHLDAMCIVDVGRTDRLLTLDARTVAIS
eukprot:6484968-Amphidinium_carterae.1